MSLYAREKWAIRRRLDAAGLRRGHRVTRHADRIRQGDAGFGLIEVVVSVALFAIIVAPITLITITTQNGASYFHNRAEAADLATQALETAQYQTANGVNPTPGITTTTQFSGNNPFKVAVDFELVAGTGASQSICIAPAGLTSSRIWTVKATVSWGHGAQSGHVVETTLISPALADLADLNAAEIAVPVYNADDATLETTTPISMTVTGSCTGSQCSGETIPGNEHTTESGNTGSTGCVVFSDLFAGAGWTYTVTASPVAPYVDPNELSDSPTASGMPTRTNVSVQANTVTVVSNPNLILASGATMTVSFQTMKFGGGTSAVLPAPYLPISVQSSTLLCSSLAAETCVLGSGTAARGFSSTSPQTALLFPGQTVTGAAPNYSAWAGDQADSEPSYNGDYGGDVATSFQALSGTVGPLVLPVYPLSLTVTVKADAGSVSGLTVIDSGGEALALNGIAGGTSASGLPLGQYQIQATVTGSNPTVSLTTGGSHPVYVWILPTGICESSTPYTSSDSPCSSPSTTALAVTVG